MAYVRGKMRSRGERTTATEVSSTEMPAANVEAATTKPAAATVEAATATMETTASAKAASVTTAAASVAATTTATTASSICGDRQDDRASQYGSARDEFRPEFQYGHRHDSLPRNQVAPSASNRCPYFNPTRDKLFQFLHRTRGFPLRKITGAPSQWFLTAVPAWLSKMNPRILAGVGDDAARLTDRSAKPNLIKPTIPAIELSQAGNSSSTAWRVLRPTSEFSLELGIRTLDFPSGAPEFSVTYEELSIVI